MNWVNEEDERKTALHHSDLGVGLTLSVDGVLLCRVLAIPSWKGCHVMKLLFFFLKGSLPACEFFLQNGAKINQKDKRGRGALHHAALLGQTG